MKQASALTVAFQLLIHLQRSRDNDQISKSRMHSREVWFLNRGHEGLSCVLGVLDEGLVCRWD